MLLPVAAARNQHSHLWPSLALLERHGESQVMAITDDLKSTASLSLTIAKYSVRSCSAKPNSSFSCIIVLGSQTMSAIGLRRSHAVFIVFTIERIETFRKTDNVLTATTETGFAYTANAIRAIKDFSPFNQLPDGRNPFPQNKGKNSLIKKPYTLNRASLHGKTRTLHHHASCHLMRIGRIHKVVSPQPVVFEKAAHRIYSIIAVNKSELVG